MSVPNNSLLWGKGRLFLVLTGIVAIGVSSAYVFLKRDASGVDLNGVKLVAPRDGATVQSMHPRFRWLRKAESTAYQFSLYEVNRTPVWSALVRDTSLVIPLSVSLAPGKMYLWHVDAIMSDENIAHSELYAFTFSQ